MDKRLSISLQGGRKVSGVLRGFDIFLNLVVDDAVEESGPTAGAPPTKLPLGQVVSSSFDSLSLSMTHALIPYFAGNPRQQCNIDGNTGTIMP